MASDPSTPPRLPTGFPVADESAPVASGGGAGGAGIEPSLAHVVRGLGALFWGLPLSLVFSAQTARTDFFGRLGFGPALFANLLLVYALWELGRCGRRTPRWQAGLFRSRFLAIMMAGLTPFLQWWKVIPGRDHFQFAVFAFLLAGLLFLGHLTMLLLRLAELLDESPLEDEARLFLGVNLPLLGAVALVACAVMAVGYSPWRPSLVVVFAPWFYRLGFGVLVMVLLPLALNMTLVWKLKQGLLDQAFSRPH